MSAPGAAPICSTATASITWSASTAPTAASKNGGEGFFTPADEPAQRALGETVLDLFRGAGAEIIAEDLGTVPDFVRASLARLGVPGYRVFRWERHWHAAGQPFRDPSAYPPVSVAASGTHDTEPVAMWWDAAPESERRLVSELEAVRRLTGGADLARRPFDATVRDVLLEVLFASASDLLLLPGAGRLRLARSRQRAGHRLRPELDLPPAVGRRHAG